jgi:hypothetical protein
VEISSLNLPVLRKPRKKTPRLIAESKSSARLVNGDVIKIGLSLFLKIGH